LLQQCFNGSRQLSAISFQPLQRAFGSQHSALSLTLCDVENAPY